MSGEGLAVGGEFGQVVGAGCEVDFAVVVAREEFPGWDQGGPGEGIAFGFVHTKSGEGFVLLGSYGTGAGELEEGVEVLEVRGYVVDLEGRVLEHSRG